ncbi:31021_t:CDS:1, partial [Racocetra persica]
NCGYLAEDVPVIFRIKDEIKSKFREFLDPNYIGTYEMEINNCPFCEGELEVKHYKK